MSSAEETSSHDMDKTEEKKSTEDTDSKRIERDDLHEFLLEQSQLNRSRLRVIEDNMNATMALIMLIFMIMLLDAILELLNVTPRTTIALFLHGMNSLLFRLPTCTCPPQ